MVDFFHVFIEICGFILNPFKDLTTLVQEDLLFTASTLPGSSPLCNQSTHYKMKNFRYLILAFITLGFVSCSGEDDSPSVESSNLVGEWHLEDMNYTGTSSFNFNGTSMTTSFTGELLESNASVFLNSDNTYTSAGNYTIRLTSNTGGMTDVQEVPVTNIDGSGTYSVNGNIFSTDQENLTADAPLTMSPVGISEATITELTAERFVLTFDHTQVITTNGMDVEVRMEGVQILTR